MMFVTYELEATCSCPVDGKPDHYAITVSAQRALPVEMILAAVEDLKGEVIFQEEFTSRLARSVNAHVRTVGHHSGVKTTVDA